MKLSSSAKTFIMHFGEMGSRWGVNRTVGQIYALIYLSEEPLNADQIVEALGFARSNVAMGIKELTSMNLIMLKHIKSDRKDYYETYEDVWQILRHLVEERRKREIDPTLSMLRSMIMDEVKTSEEQYAQKKMYEMYAQIEMLVNWYEDIEKMDTEKLIKLLKMGSKIYNLYQFKDKLKVISGGKK